MRWVLKIHVDFVNSCDYSHTRSQRGRSRRRQYLICALCSRAFSVHAVHIPLIGYVCLPTVADQDFCIRHGSGSEMQNTSLKTLKISLRREWVRHPANEWKLHYFDLGSRLREAERHLTANQCQFLHFWSGAKSSRIIADPHLFCLSQ